MRFPDWIALRVKATKKKKTELLREIGATAKISLLTMQHLEKGGHLSRYDKAKAVEIATGGKVTVKELCE